MKPAPFDYVRASSVAEAVTLAAGAGPDARFLAGGQSLVAMLNMRVATPAVLIDISRIEDANYVRNTGRHVAVGCATRQSDLERRPHVAETIPLVAKALPWVGHIQTRNRGTVCGSIAHADPSSELPLCIAVLNGEIDLVSERTKRTILGRDFFLGTLQTVRRDDELISEVRFPMIASDVGVAFNEMAIRHGDFAIISVATLAHATGLTIGIGGAADQPQVRDLPLLRGSELDEALNDLAWALDCRDDLHASASYRRHLIRTLGRKTVEEALSWRS